ncbi:hypothetical protein ATN83_1573 [Raoultella ornithinolytica]|nr:hypothetical protein ATN83_1573 [Raoultella ornithinolytica]
MNQQPVSWVRPSFSSSDLSLTLLAFGFSAGETIIENQGNTEDQKIKYCLKFKLSFEICYKNV